MAIFFYCKKLARDFPWHPLMNGVVQNFQRVCWQSKWRTDLGWLCLIQSRSWNLEFSSINWQGVSKIIPFLLITQIHQFGRCNFQVSDLHNQSMFKFQPDINTNMIYVPNMKWQIKWNKIEVETQSTHNCTGQNSKHTMNLTFLSKYITIWL